MRCRAHALTAVVAVVGLLPSPAARVRRRAVGDVEEIHWPCAVDWRPGVVNWICLQCCCLVGCCEQSCEWGKLICINLAEINKIDRKR